MKKFLSIVLALAIAMGMFTMAFADNTYKCGVCGNTYDSEEDLIEHYDNGTCYYQCDGCGKYIKASAYDTHIASCALYKNLTTEVVWEKTCPKCGKVFNSAEDYNYHIDNECNGIVNLFENLSIIEVLNKLVETFDINSAQWEQIEDVVIRLFDLIENLLSGLLVPQSDVEGAVADLEDGIEDLGLVGQIKEYVANIIKAIKEKILALYAHEVATEVTEAEEPAETGSSMVGVAAFAAVSMACAAAYVCTRKHN